MEIRQGALSFAIPKGEPGLKEVTSILQRLVNEGVAVDDYTLQRPTPPPAAAAADPGENYRPAGNNHPFGTKIFLTEWMAAHPSGSCICPCPAPDFIARNHDNAP